MRAPLLCAREEEPAEVGALWDFEHHGDLRAFHLGSKKFAQNGLERLGEPILFTLLLAAKPFADPTEDGNEDVKDWHGDILVVDISRLRRCGAT